MKQQMALGSFIFGLSRDFAYSTLGRKSEGGWIELQILNSKPKSHQLGQKAETLTITGKSMYAVAMARLDELRALQAQRTPLPLIDGIGRNWGLWRINNIQETQSQVIDDGTAMVIDWTLELAEFNNA
ncbi:phage tail protein [Pseudomonas sp. B2M1-30]|uniref:phage tail protein n=1 Tax=Pseudomonas TaxID=286 RepID=UPI0021C7743C|nr:MULTISPECIES: phage tail protein [Pseudomonas]MCU0119518.1 phage tail protein [Pseudomonas sp. B2M1-30]MCU7262332.1 phage tail protein [Pseudomonas koreensis]